MSRRIGQPSPRIAVLAAAAWALLLTACGADTTDLKRWMEEQQAVRGPDAAASAPALPAYRAMAYRGDSAGDPFDSTRLEPAARDGVDRLGQDPRAALPLLERTPLEAMQMVGAVDRGGERLALLRLDGALQAVRIGQRLGVHGGTVQQISDRSLTVSEPVRDAFGRTTRRTSILILKEARP